MISLKSEDAQRGPVYEEGGFIIDTRPSRPNRVEDIACPEGTTSEIIVIAKTMGLGYPEVLHLRLRPPPRIQLISAPIIKMLKQI